MPEIHKVVTTVWYAKDEMHELRNVFPEAKFVYVDFFDREKLREEAKDADVAILMGDVDDCLLGENSLKWIACDHAGLDGSARPEVFAKGIPVTGAAGRSAPVLAEHAVYFMLQSCYHTKELLAAQEAGHWGVDGSKDWRGLYGRKVGILGLGNNGKQLKERLAAFGMEIWAYDKFPIKDKEGLARTFCENDGDTIDPILENCDFVVLMLALTDETYHMFSDDAFRKMKKDAFLVNMARGGIVDTDALVRALDAGEIAGAGIDVVEPEPLPEGHPLWHEKNVYITPHSTPQVPNRARASIEIIRDNARRFREGLPMRNQLSERDILTGEKGKGGFAKIMNSGMTPDQIRGLHLEKYFGERGWTDPSEWDYID